MSRAWGWLETEGSEGQTRESGRPVGEQRRRSCCSGEPKEPGRQESERIVARNSRNGEGAKGAQEGGDVTDREREEEPAAVSRETKQAGEIRARWAWVEPSVWTERNVDGPRSRG